MDTVNGIAGIKLWVVHWLLSWCDYQCQATIVLALNRIVYGVFIQYSLYLLPHIKPAYCHAHSLLLYLWLLSINWFQMAASYYYKWVEVDMQAVMWTGWLDRYELVRVSRSGSGLLGVINIRVAPLLSFENIALNPFSWYFSLFIKPNYFPIPPEFCSLSLCSWLISQIKIT